MASKFASFATEDLHEGSGLFDDCDLEIAKILLTKEPPDNYQASGNPIFAIVTFNDLTDGLSPEDRLKSQSYSLGAKAGDDFTIDASGAALIPSNDTAQVRKGTKFTTFTAALQSSGVPMPMLQSGDLAKLVGIKGRFKRIADPVRNFGDSEERNRGDKKKFPPSTLVLVKLISLPGEKTTTTGNAAPAAAPSTSATAAGEAGAGGATGDMDTDTFEFLQQALLKAKDGKLQRSQVMLAVSKMAVASTNRGAYAKHAADEGYLGRMVDAGMITYAKDEKGQTISLAA